MRPTPQELATGIRTLLREAGGELQSLQARRAFRRAMAVLRDQDWNDSAFRLLDENALLAGMSAKAVDWIESQGGGGDDDRLAAARTAIEDKATPRNFEEANRRNLALRNVFAGLLDLLAARYRPQSADLRRELMADLVHARTGSSE